jgi:hypothetical protein
MPLSSKIGDYIDPTTGVVTNPYENPFGDSVWRSSWLYASMLVLRSKSPTLFDSICAFHSLDKNAPARFLNSFVAHGIGDQGWTVIGSSQKFSGDQFAPLLYLLECVAAFGIPEERNPSNAIMESLLRLEKTGTPLSDSPSGKILPNLGYVIDVLCDPARYNMICTFRDYLIVRHKRLILDVIR